MKPYSEQVLTFIQEHPSVYHVIDGQRRMLLEAGYTRLSEDSRWDLRRRKQSLSGEYIKSS